MGATIYNKTVDLVRNYPQSSRVHPQYAEVCRATYIVGWLVAPCRSDWAVILMGELTQPTTAATVAHCLVNTTRRRPQAVTVQCTATQEADVWKRMPVNSSAMTCIVSCTENCRQRNRGLSHPTDLRKAHTFRTQKETPFFSPA